MKNDNERIEKLEKQGREQNELNKKLLNSLEKLNRKHIEYDLLKTNVMSSYYMERGKESQYQMIENISLKLVIF